MYMKKKINKAQACLSLSFQGTYSKPLPLILFSGVSMAAGIFTLLLPETLGVKLPDTVEEAEKLKLNKWFSVPKNVEPNLNSDL